MEIVTRPMTLNYHLNETPWPELLNKAIPMGCLSHRFQGVNLTKLPHDRVQDVPRNVKLNTLLATLQMRYRCL